MYTYDVFISHSGNDREFVLGLAIDLKRAGLRVWLDQWDLRPGDSIATAVQQALEESRFLLVVMSPDYFQSAWTQQEWQYMLASEMEGGGVRVIPLLYRDCEVPVSLQMKQWVDLRDQNEYQFVLDRLVRDLRLLASRETTTPPPTETPKPGERVEELDPTTLAELKNVLRDAVEAFRAGPTTLTSAPIAPEPIEVDEHVCFIVMPFSIESLNVVYEDFVRPTLEDRCHLRPQRGDDVFGSNVIMEDITKSIRKARLIIADLTSRNPNVFYEVGIAHALNKQVLLMTQSIEDVPFDLRHRRALVYEYSPRGCKKLEKDLYDNVQNMLEQRNEA